MNRSWPGVSLLTIIVLEYKTKSTNHIWSLIFFPSMSTVCILKSIPFKFETKGDMVIFETEFNTRPRGGFWPQTFRHSLNMYFTSSMTLHHTLPHLCICTSLCVTQHCVRSLKQGSPVLRTRNGTYRKICNGQTLTTLPANLCCVYHIALWTCLHIMREREREREGEREKKREKKERERERESMCMWVCVVGRNKQWHKAPPPNTNINAIILMPQKETEKDCASLLKETDTLQRWALGYFQYMYLIKI